MNNLITYCNDLKTQDKKQKKPMVIGDLLNESEEIPDFTLSYENGQTSLYYLLDQ